MYMDCPHSIGLESRMLTYDKKDASLHSPDPPPDSATVAFLNENSPYMVPTYVRPTPMMVKGEGCYIWDMENRQYLDLTAGIAVTSLGHCDPDVARIVADQVYDPVILFFLLVANELKCLGENTHSLLQSLSQPLDRSS